MKIFCYHISLDWAKLPKMLINFTDLSSEAHGWVKVPAWSSESSGRLTIFQFFVWDYSKEKINQFCSFHWIGESAKTAKNAICFDISQHWTWYCSKTIALNSTIKMSNNSLYLWRILTKKSQFLSFAVLRIGKFQKVLLILTNLEI